MRMGGCIWSSPWRAFSNRKNEMLHVPRVWSSMLREMQNQKGLSGKGEAGRVRGGMKTKGLKDSGGRTLSGSLTQACTSPYPGWRAFEIEQGIDQWMLFCGTNLEVKTDLEWKASCLTRSSLALARWPDSGRESGLFIVDRKWYRHDCPPPFPAHTRLL